MEYKEFKGMQDSLPMGEPTEMIGVVNRWSVRSEPIGTTVPRLTDEHVNGGRPSNALSAESHEIGTGSS